MNEAQRNENPNERFVMSEFRPIGSIERVTMICVDKGITQAYRIESYLKRKFDDGDIDLKPTREQISAALQRLKKSGKAKLLHGMWRPDNS